MNKSTIRDGWGILYNASLHITDQAAIDLIRQIRIDNMEAFAKQWAQHRNIQVD